MERSQKIGPGKNGKPSLSSAWPMRNIEDALMERIVKYLNRRVRKYRRSHFCYFMLFLLAGRHCGAA
jgi:hypothetical protein